MELPRAGFSTPDIIIRAQDLLTWIVPRRIWDGSSAGSSLLSCANGAASCGIITNKVGLGRCWFKMRVEQTYSESSSSGLWRTVKSSKLSSNLQVDSPLFCKYRSSVWVIESVIFALCISLPECDRDSRSPGCGFEDPFVSESVLPSFALVLDFKDARAFWGAVALDGFFELRLKDSCSNSRLPWCGLLDGI